MAKEKKTEIIGIDFAGRDTKPGIITILGPEGLEIIHRVRGTEVEKVAAAVSRRVAEKLKRESLGRTG